MTTAAEYAALAATEANLAATAAVDVQNKVAIAESSANLATTHAATVGASVDAAEASSDTATIQAIVAENYRDLAQLWANADPNVIVEGTAFSARHQALSTIATLAAMQVNLDGHTDAYAANKSATDAAIAYLAYRLDNGLLEFDSSDLDTDISNLNGSVNNALANKLNIALYNTDTLGLAEFAESNKVSLDNKIIDYLDEAGQIALQAMLAGAENTTRLSYAGVVVDADTGIISNNAGSAVATEYGVRMATAETNLDGQGKYTVQVQQQLNDNIATVKQELETSITNVSDDVSTVESKYSVKVDAAGRVAGFGLISTANTASTGTGGFSEFIIAADSFKVGGTGSPTAPFRVITDGGVTGGGVCVSSTGVETGGVLESACTGTWLPPGTWMDNVYMNAANVAGTLTIGGPVQTAIAAAQSNAQTYTDTNFVTNITRGQDLDAISAQIDGSFTNWFLGGVPTLLNAPASTWTTTAAKNSHISDLYYNTTALAEQAYRFVLTGSTYSWEPVLDSGTIKALADVILAKEAADAAQEDADAANLLLVNIAADSKITPLEKLTLKPMWDVIQGEAVLATGTIIVQAGTVGVSTTSFSAAYLALHTYLITTLSDVFSPMTDTTDIVRSAWDTAWEDYYTARTTILNEIAQIGYDLADGKRRVFVTTPTTPYDEGDLWDVSDGIKRCTNAKLATESYAAADWAVISTVGMTTTEKGVMFYGTGTTKINGANIQSGTITLLPQDVGVGSGATTGNRMVVNSSSIKVYDSNSTVRVKLGLL